MAKDPDLPCWKGKKFVRAFFCFFEKIYWIGKSAAFHMGFKKKGAGIVNSMEDFFEFVPVNASFIGKEMGIFAWIVVDMDCEEAVVKLFE